MALSAGEVAVAVKGDTKGLGNQIKTDTENEVGGADFSGAGKIIGAAIAVGIGAAMVGIAAIVKTGIDESLDASKGIAQLQAGIESTGNAAGVSVKGMTDLATSIQNMSGQTDDSIVKAESLLQTFTNIRNEGPNKIFDDATLAAANMAAKMGGDASDQAIRLGKALNDPTNGMTALRKVGVAFTEDQAAQVTALQASGDMMGAQKIILGELNKEFGGSAEAAGKSLPGQLEILKRHFEDMSQGLVEQFMPTLSHIVDFLGDLLDGFTSVSKYVGANMNWIGPLAGTLVALGVAIYGVGIAMQVEAAGGLAAYVAASFPAIASTWAFTTALLANPITWIVLGVVALIGAIILLAMNWDVVVKWITDVWGGFVTWITDVFNNMVLGFQIIGDAISKWWNDLWSGIVNWFTDMFTAYITTVFAIFNGLLSFFTDIGRNISNWWNGMWSGMISYFQGVFTGIGDFVSGIFKGVANGILSAVNWVIDMINGVIDGINTALDGLRIASGGSIDLHINQIGHMALLAEGGIVSKPTLAMIGEGREPEAVVPLSKLGDVAGKGKGGNTIVYNAAPGASFDAEQDLFAAMRRAKLLVGW